MKLISIAVGLMLVIVPRGTDDPEAASLGGRVTDESQVGIASATVSARNVFSGETEYARTDQAGEYRFAGMNQGRYSVFARAEGYSCRWVMNVILHRGKHTQLDLVLTTSRKDEPSEGCKESSE
jgi:hypothetical protein